MNKLSGFGILAGVGLILANQCIYTVNPGERVNHNLFSQALILDNVWGLKQTYIQAIVSKFLSSKYPTTYAQKVIIYDCRLKPIDISVSTGTKISKQ